MAIFGRIATDRSELAREFGRLSEIGNVRRGASPGHKDGWGIVVYENGAPLYFGRSTNPAYLDEEYRQACRKITDSESVVMAHLRKRSVGALSLENTQPLICGKWSFGHNGTLYSPKFSQTGQSDSRLLFEELVRAIEESKNRPVEEVIVETIRSIRDEALRNPGPNGRTYSSLTFMLSDGQSLYVLRDCTDDDYYYTMYYSEQSSGVVFCQEQISHAQWKLLENRELAIVDEESAMKRVKC